MYFVSVQIKWKNEYLGRLVVKSYHDVKFDKDLAYDKLEIFRDIFTDYLRQNKFPSINIDARELSKTQAELINWIV